MIKILPASEIRALDAYTIEQEKILSIDLMERACRAFVKWFTEHFDDHQPVGIVCGMGNNGGDGLGVARMLNALGYAVKVWVVRGAGTETADFTTNRERVLESKVDLHEITGEPSSLSFIECVVLIDALFGSGISRPITGVHKSVVEAMNNADAVRVAIDIPSGLMPDQHTEGPVVKADYTVSFQSPKLAFLLPRYHEVVGEWAIVDIGLSKDFIRRYEATQFLLSQKDIPKLIKQRTRFEHKGNFGHALLIAGSFGKMGAAILASRAALRSGLGLLTVHTPGEGYAIMQTSVPEAMASVDRHSNFFMDLITELGKYTTIGIGPGLGTAPQTVKAFAHVLRTFERPMVIDADGLNMLAEHRELLTVIPRGSILTPHPKEFERLVGKWRNDFERLKKQKELAIGTKSVVVLKGANSSIATPDGKVYFNSTGNPGMATGGSGDVLTGILTGLLAQQYDSVDAAQLGVYIHGLSGDLAAIELGMNSLIASDLVAFLPSAFLRLHRS